jgi:hypothetical protein
MVLDIGGGRIITNNDRRKAMLNFSLFFPTKVYVLLLVLSL